MADQDAADTRNIFTDEAFDYRVSKDQKVFITWYGKQVLIVKGQQASHLLARLEGRSRREVQLALAKITGNFKRGNER